MDFINDITTDLVNKLSKSKEDIVYFIGYFGNKPGKGKDDLA